MPSDVMKKKTFQEHEFLFGVKKTSEDGKKWQIQIMTRSKGMPIEEAIFHLEGWLHTMKRRIWNERFGKMQFGNQPK